MTNPNLPHTPTALPKKLYDINAYVGMLTIRASIARDHQVAEYALAINLGTYAKLSELTVKKKKTMVLLRDCVSGTEIMVSPKLILLLKFDPTDGFRKFMKV